MSQTMLLTVLIELHFRELWPESKEEVEQGINFKIILSFIMKLVVDIYNTNIPKV